MSADKEITNSRKIQAEERRLKILDTALTVFAEKGVARTTIKDIAAAAGMSSGLMYHYFPGKESLLEAAVARHSFLPQMREILQNTGGKSFREVSSKIARQFLALIEQKKEIVTVFLRENMTNASVHKVWTGLGSDGVSRLRDYTAGRIAAGELREHDAETTARCLLSSLVVLNFTGDIFNSTRAGRERFIEDMIDIVVNGIGEDGE
jgi:AcrR family transcriptional regulator